MLTRPFKFKPYLKSVIWGGQKIAAYKNIDAGITDLGESWELSALPGHESIVVDHSELCGLTIPQLIELYGVRLLGHDAVERTGLEFPLLVKLIDAHRDLSVQVHPGDALARQRHGGSGKTEMWYIIDAEPGAMIYSGLSRQLTPEEYTRRIADNTIMEVIGAYHSEVGQFYFVPAGTLHAIGAGNLVAEIQQPSDVTYRVYDYDRRDANGNPRQLHIALAKDAIDYTFPHKILPTAHKYVSTEPNAVASDYFKVGFYVLDHDHTYNVQLLGRSFAIIMVTYGTLSITFADGAVISYAKGSTLLVPAAMPDFTLGGDAKVLLVRV